MTDPIRLIISGSSTVDPTDEAITNAVLDLVIGVFRIEDSDPDDVARARSDLGRFVAEVICGKDGGGDAAGEHWARARGIDVHPELVTEADRTKHGPYLAPHARNRRMADRASAAVIFWDGKSAGSSDLAARMLARRRPVAVIPYRPREPRRRRR